MSQFPSSIISFSTKADGQIINAADINSPQNEITALETKVGTDGSADTTSLDYKVSNASSDGGGHVQTANKGGTGQTSYTKGDLLVASSSSVLGKLGIGANNGDFLIVDNSTTSGMKWGNNRIASSASIMSISSVLTTSILSASIPASTLGAMGAIRTTAYVTHLQGNSATSSILLRANYGNTAVASVLLVPGSVGSVVGKIEYTLISNNSTISQRGNMVINLNKGDQTSFSTPSSILSTMVSGTSTEDAGSTLPIGITATFPGSNTTDRIDINGYTVEKI